MIYSLYIGIPGLIRADMVKEGAAVIDVGKLCIRLQLVGLMIPLIIVLMIIPES